MAHPDSDHLFSKYDLRTVLDNQAVEARKRIDLISPSRVLDPDALVAETVEAFRIGPIDLFEQNITVDHEPASLDVSRDFDRHVMDRTQPFHVPGTRVSYYVPFEGERQLLDCRPSAYSYNPPQARVLKNEIVFDYHSSPEAVAGTKSASQRDMANLRQWLAWANRQVNDFNAAVEVDVHAAVMARRQMLQQSVRGVETLGFKARTKQPLAAPSTPASAPPKRSTARQPNQDREYDVALSYAGRTANSSSAWQRSSWKRVCGCSMTDFRRSIYGGRTSRITFPMCTQTARASS